MTAAPATVNTRLSNSIRPMVIIARPASASSTGLYPHRRHVGVKKNASGIPASITITYATNHFDPGTLIPRGASKRTRQAGHFGSSAKINDESDDDKKEYAGALDCSGTIPRY